MVFILLKQMKLLKHVYVVNAINKSLKQSNLPRTGAATATAAAAAATAAAAAATAATATAAPTTHSTH